MSVLCTMTGVLGISAKFPASPPGDPSPGETVDYDRELMTTGWADLILGITGGIITFHRLGSTVQLRMDGGTHRLSVFACAAFCFGFPPRVPGGLRWLASDTSASWGPGPPVADSWRVASSEPTGRLGPARASPPRRAMPMRPLVVQAHIRNDHIATEWPLRMRMWARSGPIRTVRGDGSGGASPSPPRYPRGGGRAQGGDHSWRRSMSSGCSRICAARPWSF